MRKLQVILRPSPSTRGRSNQHRLFLRIPSCYRDTLRRLSGPSILAHTNELPEKAEDRIVIGRRGFEKLKFFVGRLYVTDAG